MEISNDQQTPVAHKDTPQVEYIPRSKPTKSYLQRKIEQYQTEAWGPERRELDLIPHIGKLQRELKELKENKLAGAQFDEEMEVKRLVDEMFKSIDCDLPPLGQSIVQKKSKLQQEQEEFQNSLRSSGAEGEQMDTTLDANLPKEDSFGGAGLGEILKIHKSSLMKEQEFYRKYQESLEGENMDMEMEMQAEDEPENQCNQNENNTSRNNQNVSAADQVADTGKQDDTVNVQFNNEDCSLMEMAQQGGRGLPVQHGLMTPQVTRNQQYNFKQGALTVPAKRGNILVNIDEHAQDTFVGASIPEDGMDCMEDEQMNVENEQPNDTKEETVLNKDGNVRSPQSAGKTKKEVYYTPKRVMSPVDEALTELTKLQARTMDPCHRTPYYRYRTPSPKKSV